MKKLDVTLPDLGEETVDKVVLAIWHADVGDDVSEGADLAEVTTDKAAFTLPAPSGGRVIERLANEGDEIAVGSVICVLEMP
jgi:pyruvate/2-oxoglutarate dehydrogenase complex dihydrolipoamide acyltransferase (E2) component